MATHYWEIAALSAYDRFSEYKYLIVNTSVFGVGFSFCLRHFLIIAYLYLCNYCEADLHLCIRIRRLLVFS